ncbi:transposase zinc-binding domain-containing protein, partial [Porticoccus sp. GXU_MW_L64]
MGLADVFERYLPRYQCAYGGHTSVDQWSAIRGCRGGQYGDVLLSCRACHHQGRSPRSCGHRSCSRCQNHTTTQWLQRQTQKLLPVRYFMVTFTLPRELRPLAKQHSTVVYNALFQCA